MQHQTYLMFDIFMKNKSDDSNDQTCPFLLLYDKPISKKQFDGVTDLYTVDNGNLEIKKELKIEDAVNDDNP